MKNKKLRFGIIFLFLLCIGIVHFIRHPDNTKEPPKISFPVVYKAIADSQKKGALIGYELRGEGNETFECNASMKIYPKYSVVIHNLDHAKDDYKNYCRQIVADVMQTVHAREIGIYIYDEYAAYHLLQQDQALARYITEQDMQFINSHTVACYGPACDDEYYGTENWYLQFYPGLSDPKLNEREVFPAQRQQ